MSYQDSKHRKGQAETNQKHLSQQHALYTNQGNRVQFYHDGQSTFDRVIGTLGEMKENDKVRLVSDKDCTGIVKWIGRYHMDPGAVVDEELFIVGVKLESINRIYKTKCSYGDLNDEFLVQSTRKDILFKYLPEWMPVEDRKKEAVSSAMSVYSKFNAEDVENGHVRQSPGSRFDRIDLEVNGLHVGSRVKLETGSVGTIRWIGCYHKKLVKLKDYIVGVELDSTANEHKSLLTDGWHDCERLVESKKKNIKFTKLSKVTEELQTSSTTPAAKALFWNGTTSDGYLIQLRKNSKSSFDRVSSDISNYRDGDRVILYSDRNITGTIKWIGCDHGQASKTACGNFTVGVLMDNPGNGFPRTLTDGTYCGERLTESHQKDVLFTQLKHCTLKKHVDAQIMAASGSPMQRFGELKTAETVVGGVSIRISHNDKSQFDKVLDDMRGVHCGDRVHLRSDNTITGTVKWIGCYHGLASKIEPKDFLVAVQMDEPEKVRPITLTDGTYQRERLVQSPQKNIVFNSIGLWSLMTSLNIEPGKKNVISQLNDMPQAVTTLDAISIEISHDENSQYDKVYHGAAGTQYEERVHHGVAGIHYGDKVYLRSDKTRTGTVKWIGCNHGKADETNSKDFFVGLAMDKPKNEKNGELTDGILMGERVMKSPKVNMKFTLLYHCTVVDSVDAKLEGVNDTVKPPNIQPLMEIPMEVSCGHFVTVRLGHRVQLYSDERRTGTIRWLGCHRSDGSQTDTKDFFVGVEMDDPKLEPDDQLTNGEYCGERLLDSQKRNIVFAPLQYCESLQINDSRMDEKRNTAEQSKRELQPLEEIPIEISDSGTAGFAMVRRGHRVQLYSSKTKTGTVRWLGCHLSKDSNIDATDVVVGVEMDNPENQPADTLTDGTYYGQQLVRSQRKNIVFDSLQYCTLVTDADTEPKKADTATASNRETEWTRSHTEEGISIEIFNNGRSTFDKVQSVYGIRYGNRVFLYNDPTITGTVIWIGCKHGQASSTVQKEFIVGIALDKPDGEVLGVCTDGTYYGERLVSSQENNVIFRPVKYCTVLTDAASCLSEINKTVPAVQEELSTICTLGGIPIEISHDTKSQFDMIHHGVDGIHYGDKIYLHPAKTTTGTVKWIGCYHGEASTLDPTHFIVGVAMDDINKVHPDMLTDGSYFGEKLVVTQQRNILFIKRKYCVVISSDGAKTAAIDTKKQSEDVCRTVKTTEGLFIEIYHDGESLFDRVIDGTIAGIQNGDEVHVHSNKTRTGTVKWIGCNHGLAATADPKEFDIGVEMDRPEKELVGSLTNGSLCGQQLIFSPETNIKFTKVKYWTLIKRRETTNTSGFPELHSKDCKLLAGGDSSNLLRETKSASHISTNRKEFESRESSDTTRDSSHRPLGPSNEERTTSGNLSSLKTKSFSDTRNNQNKESEILGNNESPPKEINEAVLQKKIQRQHSRDGQTYDSATRNVTSSRAPKPSPRMPGTAVQLSDSTSPQASSRNLKPSPDDLRIDLGPIKKVEAAPEKINNVFIENEVSRLTDVKQKVALRIQNVSSADISMKGDGRGYSAPTDTKPFGPPQPSTTAWKGKRPDQQLPMEVDDFSGQDYGFPQNQFDSEFLLRGEVKMKRDKTFYTVIIAFKPSEKHLADETGEPLEDVVEETVLPPTDPDQYNDMWKGVQGDLNSCYMDASMFAMFSYLTVFDELLFSQKSLTDHAAEGDAQRAENIRLVLRTKIVNPLRKYGLAQKKGMHELRNLLDEYGLVKGLTGDEKDPEEFLNLLLVNTFSTPSPIVLSNGQESHLFHILADKEEGMDFPTVQELLERTCIQESFKLKKIPPYLILHLPRYGKDYKMYPQIMPSLELDITDILSGTHQSCYVCGEDATFECYGCYKTSFEISESSFCNGCVQDYHKPASRRQHKPQKLVVDVKASDGLSTAKCVLKLAAVLCIETSHYVTFVASDTSADARWYFFDSMADREGTTNIPKVTEVKDLRHHLSEAKKSLDRVPPLISRLVKDAYICFYTNPDIPQYNAIEEPLNTTMPGGTTRV